MGDAEHPGAALLSASAHDLRNHVATIRSVVRLVDDEEVADALDEASRALQLAIERAVVLSRMELGERPDVVDIPMDQLCSVASRRVGRETGGIHDVLMDAGAMVAVPGPWAERLVADLLHHATITGVVGGTIEFELRSTIDAVLSHALVALADACGGSLVFDGPSARLELPLSEG